MLSSSTGLRHCCSGSASPRNTGRSNATGVPEVPVSTRARLFCASEVLVRPPEPLASVPHGRRALTGTSHCGWMPHCDCVYRTLEELRMHSSVGRSIACVRLPCCHSLSYIGACCKSSSVLQPGFCCSLQRHADRTLHCNLHRCMLHCMLQLVACCMLRRCRAEGALSTSCGNWIGETSGLHIQSAPWPTRLLDAYYYATVSVTTVCDRLRTRR